ncbi:MAG TPA: hypothetical protein VES89_12680 [Candidatus Competibacteraceae bacterium]|nr:hypothetical protein [Candidatus Competibacteraceae bacterium]
MSMPRQHHSYADVFPMMAEVEFERLVEARRVNGYNDRLPIATLDGKILDGRNPGRPPSKRK